MKGSTKNDNVLIQPVVFTVKKDRSVNVALVARALINAIRKDKHQMPYLECLIEQIEEIINEPGEREVLYSLT